MPRREVQIESSALKVHNYLNSRDGKRLLKANGLRRSLLFSVNRLDERIVARGVEKIAREGDRKIPGLMIYLHRRGTKGLVRPAAAIRVEQRTLRFQALDPEIKMQLEAVVGGLAEAVRIRHVTPIPSIVVQ